MIEKSVGDEVLALGDTIERTAWTAHVQVTDRHVRRALHAMEGTVADARADSGNAGGPECVLLAAAVVAAIEAFGERVPEGALAQYNLVEEALGRDMMRDFAIMSYDLVEGPVEPPANYGAAVEARLALLNRSLASA